ncbi:MAG: FHA domain-containing protein [Planctomycetota bacterium]
MAVILVVSGKSQGSSFPIGAGSVIVGRGDVCDFRVNDEMVSRRHMRIRFDRNNEQFHVADLESANGVFINGRQITGEARLQDNDLILIGESKLRFTVRDESTEETVLR